MANRSGERYDGGTIYPITTSLRGVEGAGEVAEGRRGRYYVGSL